MTMFDPQADGDVARRPNVSDVVAVSQRGDGFAYAPAQVLVRGEEAGRRAQEVSEAVEDAEGNQLEIELAPLSEREADRGARGWWIATNLRDPLAAVDLLVAEGYAAQPNHAFFAHACGSACPPHPAVVQELVQYGWFADPLRANPLRANPLRANPLRANPLRANPLRANNPMENTAVPAVARRLPDRTLNGPGTAPTVIVLDTGLAPLGVAAAAAPDHSAPVLRAGMAPNLGRIRGAADVPDDAITLPSGPVAADGYLDPAAGHGTFIAGIVEQLAPGCTIDVRRVIGQLGDAIEQHVANEIHAVVTEVENGQLARPVIISMSFGGQTLGVPGYLREAVARAAAARIPMVASAGNDGLCTPQFPAAFANVVAVAALGPDGPAPWTNYGDWVDACAPGTDMVSAFFDNFNGAFPTMNGYDPDRFGGWAEWSGTSFAVPVVVAAIARELVAGRSASGGDIDAMVAVDRVVRASHLARLPCLGTVINI